MTPIHYVNDKIDILDNELVDYNPQSEKIIDWKSRKIYSELVADTFGRVGKHKTAANIRMCGTDLIFKLYQNGDKRLHKANFCRHRLCPLCTWRKSLKKYAQISQMMGWLQQYDYKYIFITLTVRNCEGDDLGKTLDLLLKGYNNLFRYKVVKNVYLGAFRALEVTYNYDKANYHPHIHMIVAVNKSYFTSRNYISQRKLVDLWQDALEVNYKPIVDIRKVDERECNLSHAVAEVAKYTVKGSDYIMPYDLDVQDNVIITLDNELNGRRFTSVRGVFLKAQKALKIDLEDQDLTHCDLEQEVNPQLEYVLVHYKWHFGDSRYLLEGFIDKNKII